MSQMASAPITQYMYVVHVKVEDCITLHVHVNQSMHLRNAPVVCHIHKILSCTKIHCTYYQYLSNPLQ